MNDMRKLIEAVERAQSGTPVTESEMQTDGTDDPHHPLFIDDVVDHPAMGKVTVLAVHRWDDRGNPAEFRVRKQDGSEQVVNHDYLKGYDNEILVDPISETDDPHRHFSKNDLIQKVIQQILDDVGNNDFTAIAELLEFIPDDKLAGFLSDY